MGSLSPTTLAAALLAALALALGGCGGSSSGPGPGAAARRLLGSAPARSPAALRVERIDFVRVTEGLEGIVGPVTAEVGAARGAWPAIADGLPAKAPARLVGAIAAAEARARAIPTPLFISEAGQMTGPAAGLAGLLQAFEGLLVPCWEHVRAAAAAGGSGGAFLRANAALYIGCVYDAHYDLSSIGEELPAAYGKLGGEGAFGRSLPRARVEALAGALGVGGARLEPKAPEAPEAPPAIESPR